jgi:hypothetical protein
MIKHLTVLIAFLMMISSQASAATNAETIQYIFDKHEAECIAEQYEVLNAKEGETPEVTVDLKLDGDNIYEITIGRDGKTATVFGHFKVRKWGVHAANDLVTCHVMFS